ncbi:MAG: CDP-diacylglycerol--glycerol-3-phosphate 3-phosphatidyltransferase [Deltaproteobacteria bacterium]|nr:CDP-diacylglycerol--glycerol-3-phosphate 3-phosphatidyltransferase [Deltaproteobacteria bacterium]
MPTSADSATRAVGAVTENFWNLPNAITLLRIGLTPLLLLLPWFEGPAWSAIMGFGFLAISLTDLLDGYLARLHGTESRIGKLLDPLADKFLVMTAFVMLVAVGRIPSWALPLVIAILGREFAVTALRAMMSAEGVVIGASPLGKWKTGFQIAALTALLVHFPLLGLPVQELGLVLLIIATGLTVWSGYEYFAAYLAGRARP